MNEAIMNAPKKEWIYPEFNVISYLADLNAHREMFSEILKNNPQSILEIGTGSGSMSIFLDQIGIPRVTAIDNSSKTLKNAKHLSNKFLRNVDFILYDAFKLTDIFKKNQFDIVFSQGFFEHFDDNEIKCLLNEQLEIGKIIIFSVPSNFYPTKDFGNERLLSKRVWAKILKEYNVEFIKPYGLGNKLKPIIISILKHPYPPILKPYHLLIKIKNQI